MALPEGSFAGAQAAVADSHAGRDVSGARRQAIRTAPLGRCRERVGLGAAVDAFVHPDLEAF